MCPVLVNPVNLDLCLCMVIILRDIFGLAGIIACAACTYLRQLPLTRHTERVRD